MVLDYITYWVKKMWGINFSLLSASKRKVIFINNSTRLVTACIYQEIPPNHQGDFVKLAWLAKKAHSGVTEIFNWKESFSFIWSNSGTLTDGTVIRPSQTISANLDTDNLIGLEYSQGAYLFSSTSEQKPSGSLYIKQSSSIPIHSKASVGIGMGNRALFVAQAGPNLVYSLDYSSSTPKYFIVAGNYQRGEVLPDYIIEQTAPLIFEPGVNSITATLQINNTWKIESNS